MVAPAFLRNAVPVAGNGLLDRRLFLQQGLVLASAGMWSAVAQAQTLNHPNNLPWLHQPGQPFSNYGQPGRHEQNIVRWIAAHSSVPGNGVSWCPLHQLEGTIVPNGLHFERHHHGVPDIDPKQHQLLLHGLVKQPLRFEVDTLLRYPMQTRQCFIECGGNSNQAWNSEPVQTAAGYLHGLVSASEWVGIPLRVLLDEAGVQPQAKWLIAEGADAFRMQISIPIEKARDDALLALYQNGERLRPENGYPVRLLLPGWEGVTQVKWLRRLELSDQPIMARNETARYTDLLPSGKARMFSYVMDAKSLITRPSAGMVLAGVGVYQIIGLAWSGRGKIARVEVSADAGRSWAEAALDEPIHSKCFTRFRIPWRWDGHPVTLMSRATDETGYRQPEREQLLAERGRNSYYHYNAIVAWEVDDEGWVSHVYA